MFTTKPAFSNCIMGIAFATLLRVRVKEHSVHKELLALLTFQGWSALSEVCNHMFIICLECVEINLANVTSKLECSCEKWNWSKSSIDKAVTSHE